MSKLLEYLRLCRLCLVKENVNVPIFADSSDVRQIFLKISACLPVKVSQDDNLPKHICDSCLYKVDLLYQFWNTSVNAEKQLIQWITELGLTVTSKKDAPVHLMAQSQSHSQPHSITETIMLKEEHLEMETQQQHSYSGFDIPYQPEVNMTVGASADLDSALHEDVKVGGSKRRGRPPKQKVLVTSAPPVSVPVLAGRKRRSSATKAAAAFAAHASSDDSDADDKLASDTSEPDFEPAITKEEADSEDEEYVDNPDSLEPTTFVDASSTCDPEQAGPSGLMGAPVTTRNAAMPANTEPGSEEAKEDLELNKLTQEADKYIEFVNGPDSREYKQYKCPKCPKSFQYKSKFLSHCVKHITVKKCVCPVCNKMLKSKSSITQHMKLHDHRAYRCEVCQKDFALKSGLDFHYKHYPPTMVAPCTKCDQKFHTKLDLLVHTTRNHQSSFSCYSCEEPFPDIESLKVHVMQHNGSVTSQYQCEYCGRQFSGRQSLNVHRKGLHLDVRSVICDICGKKLSCKRSLEDHIRVHKGEKPLSCERCGKQFATKNTLRIHVRTHTGERPHACPYCDKRFTQRNSLVVHIRKHTGDKPYACELCHEKFVSRSCLKIHSRSRHQLL